MLRARLKDTINSPGITAVLPIAESKRLILAKTNGNVEVYSRENNKFKLFQVYPNILKNLHIDDPEIFDLLYSEQLSTIFVQCKNVVLLLNSFNLHVYDRIVDKRGISKWWLTSTVIYPSSTETDDGYSSSPESENLYEANIDGISHNDDSMSTFLLYATGKPSKLRLLIWKGRIYKSMVEIKLPGSKEHVTSVNATPNGMIITTNNGVYVWSYSLMELIRIQKIVERTFPIDMVSAIVDLRRQCDLSYPDKIVQSGSSNYEVLERVSSSQGSNITKKSSLSGFWHRRTDKDKGIYRKIRYSFNDTNSSPFIVDGLTESLFEVNLERDKEPFLITNKHGQFFEWNPSFENVEYISTDILMMYNSKEIRFVDYKNGFTFLEEYILDGIKKVEKVLGTYLIIWTNNDRILLYHYQVDDDITELDGNSDISSDQDSADDVTICGKFHDSDFYYLWRKVLFYQFFLRSPYSVELCASPNPEVSLDVCAMKLRDFTVLWCLKIFDALEDCLKILNSGENELAKIANKNKTNRPIIEEKYIRILEEIIVKGVFTYFIDVWAPPQLVILNTFPPDISKLVNFLTNEEHQCVNENHSMTSVTLSKSIPDLFRKWVIPYLTDTRRNLKNLQKNNNTGITWNYYNRSIQQKLDFFLLDNHGQVTIDDMLRLVDTVLFKMYIKYAPKMVGPLIRVGNSCDPVIVVKTLKSCNMPQELIGFYYQQNKHGDALKYLVSLLDGATSESNKAKVKELVKVLIISYLKSMDSSYMKDIMQYSSWLIENYGTTELTKCEILKDIFFDETAIGDKNNGMQIYQFIKKYSENLSLTYLEVYVSAKDIIEHDIIYELIERYLVEISNIKVRRKLKSVLELPLEYNVSKVYTIFDRFLDRDRDSDGNSLKSEVRRFIKIMETYPLFKDSEHKHAIDILYSDLGDYKKSSLYCDRLYESDRNRGVEIILYLFEKVVKQYLESTEEVIMNVENGAYYSNQVMMFLKDQGSRIDSLMILERLPQSIPIQEIGKELTNVIMSKQNNKEEETLEKSLLQVELVNESFSLNKELSKFVTLNETYKCPVCKKPFSIFTSEEVLWHCTDGKDYIVHYNCGKVRRSRSFSIQANINKSSMKPRTVKDMKNT
ncbi:similar to Saccharomyces cerevisiae YDL077C VAM6 Vacuolar protein [Maudiozyma saulgeensis]|uniref:Similar to Saccharomyces cerevisiae YDL077C VAM6 Vacuolar protein n=1 Tax=Maudiozyma saulgeensis TaxID=1789683 RepID=A0A1X7QZ57_9SACH|nr:similar to Saccharomyces cerevisiae YDL077C VAM6 Vacuolar protein [Kazachstania saulgeensis]